MLPDDPPLLPPASVAPARRPKRRSGGRGSAGAAASLVSAILHILALIFLAASVMEGLGEPIQPTVVAQLLSPVTFSLPLGPDGTNPVEPAILSELPAGVGSRAMADSLQMQAVSLSRLPEPAEEPPRIVADEMVRLATAFAPDDGIGLTDVGQKIGGATFFGVKAGGTRFVFVVDGSRSMNDGRWEACKRELVRAVESLHPYQRFYVILFAEKSYPIFDRKTPETRCLGASRENVARLKRWLDEFPLEYGTKPQESMQRAVELTPDAIYLLTDGEFTDGTEAYLSEANRRVEEFTNEVLPKVSVHTICFYSDRGREVLQRIARENQGTYRYVNKRP